MRDTKCLRQFRLRWPRLMPLRLAIRAGAYGVDELILLVLFTAISLYGLIHYREVFINYDLSDLLRTVVCVVIGSISACWYLYKKINPSPVMGPEELKADLASTRDHKTTKFDDWVAWLMAILACAIVASIMLVCFLAGCIFGAGLPFTVAAYWNLWYETRPYT